MVELSNVSVIMVRPLHVTLSTAIHGSESISNRKALSQSSARLNILRVMARLRNGLNAMIVTDMHSNKRKILSTGTTM